MDKLDSTWGFKKFGSKHLSGSSNFSEYTHVHTHCICKKEHTSTNEEANSMQNQDKHSDKS
jgi:hypothetical protein